MNDIGKFMTASALTLGLTLPPACLAQANTEAAAAASLQADRLTEGEIRRGLENARKAAGESPDGPPPGTAAPAPVAVPTAAPPKPTSAA